MRFCRNGEDKNRLNLGEIQKLLEAEVLTEETAIGMEVKMVMASDLMSDVLSYCCSGALLVTGLTNAQTVRTAEVADLCAVVFTRGKRPSDETVRLAQQSKIPLFATTLPMYEVCGALYSHGLKGVKD
jgi:predicted transcriptional regulator